MLRISFSDSEVRNVAAFLILVPVAVAVVTGEEATEEVAEVVVIGESR